jgi:hypothetical protein
MSLKLTAVEVNNIYNNPPKNHNIHRYIEEMDKIMEKDIENSIFEWKLPSKLNKYEAEHLKKMCINCGFTAHSISAKDGHYFLYWEKNKDVELDTLFGN